MADILGKPLSGARTDSVLGVAMVAATSIGLFQNIKDAVQSMASKSFYLEPLEDNVESYWQVYGRFKRLKSILGQYSENLD